MGKSLFVILRNSHLSKLKRSYQVLDYFIRLSVVLQEGTREVILRYNNSQPFKGYSTLIVHVHSDFQLIPFSSLSGRWVKTHF